MTHEVRLTEEADRNLIAARPIMYPVVWRETHRELVNRFPFGLYYRIESGIAVVVAVMHGSRNPRSWQKRKK